MIADVPRQKMVAPGEVFRSLWKKRTGVLLPPRLCSQTSLLCCAALVLPPERGDLPLLTGKALASLRTRSFQILLFPGYISPTQEVWGWASIRNRY